MIKICVSSMAKNANTAIIELSAAKILKFDQHAKSNQTS